MLLLLLPVISLTKIPCLGLLIDAIAALWLVYGTIQRKHILQYAEWTHDACAALNADKQTVEQFLYLSMVSWIASIVFEFKSCKFLWKISLASYRLHGLKGKDIVALLISLLGSANACWVMLNFSSNVHRSFENITQDSVLLVYFCLAAFFKNARIFQQGILLTL